TTDGVLTQARFWQRSLVHRLLSVHVFVLSAVKTQPCVGATHASSVHAFWSLHTTAACEHWPVAGTHVSVVQTLLSLQALGSVTWMQPCWGSQTSVVHRLPSLQLCAVQQPAAVTSSTPRPE